MNKTEQKQHNVEHEVSVLSFITCCHGEKGTKLKLFVPTAELIASVLPLHQESGTSGVPCGLISTNETTWFV